MAGIISVSGLSSTDPRVTTFVVEVYSNSGLTTLVDVGTGPGALDPSTGLVYMVGPIVFDNLIVGTTYYLRSCTVAPSFGRSDWSATYSLAAGNDGSITFGSGPASGTATDGAMYFDTSGTSYVMYIWHSAAWRIVGTGAGGSGGVFSSGSNANGAWTQDPTGHTHQWGTVTTDINGGTVAVTFPVAFASGTGVVVNVTTKSSTDRITYVVDGSVSASGFTVGNNGSSGFAYWEADGPGTPGTNLILTNPMTTKGDVIVAAAAGAPARLAVGTDGQVLTARSSATDGVDWETLSGGMTNPMTTAGDTIYGGTSGVPGRLAGDTAGKVLTSNGATSAPSWQTPSGGTGGFPFTVLQRFQGASVGNSTTTTITFPKALQSGSTTAWIILSIDGSGAFTVPSGWTADINQTASTYARLVVMHKTSASDTSVTLSTANITTGSWYFFELSGTRTIDQIAVGSSGNSVYVETGAITPTAGGLVFNAAAFVPSTNTSTPIIAPFAYPDFAARYQAFGSCGQPSGGSVNGARMLTGFSALNASANTSTTPPAISIPGWTLFTGGGVAFASFSII
jgi:hypothetical protein